MMFIEDMEYIFGSLLDELLPDEKCDDSWLIRTIGVHNVQIRTGGEKGTTKDFPLNINLVYDLGAQEYLGRGAYVDVDNQLHRFEGVEFAGFTIHIKSLNRVLIVCDGEEKTYLKIDEVRYADYVECWYGPQ